MRSAHTYFYRVKFRQDVVNQKLLKLVDFSRCSKNAVKGNFKTRSKRTGTAVHFVDAFIHISGTSLFCVLQC